MQKHLLLVVLGSLLLLARPVLAAQQGGIAAVVNDSIVTVSDIEARTDLYLSGGGKPSEEERQKMKSQVLDKLIDEALQLQEAKKIGITVSEDQVTAGFGYIAKQNNLSPDEFRQRLKDSGVNVDSLYAQIRAEIAWDSVVRRQLRPQVNISESEIDMTLDQLAQNGGKKQYHVAEIFFNAPDDASARDAESKAEEAIGKIKGGATFSSVARAVSQSPGAANGGDLGWVQDGQLEKAVNDVLVGMNPGQLSKPIRGDKGYHIIFLREVRLAASDTSALAPAAPAPAAPAAEAGPIVLLKQIIIPVSNKDSESVIKAKYARGVALKQEIKDCDALDKRMKEFPAKGTGTIGEGPQKALHPQLRAIVEKLAVGELSAPLHMPAGWGMIMVCHRKDAAAPVEAAAPTAPAAPADKNDEKARESVADRLGVQRLGKMADHYLHDLRAAAFIDKRI